MEELDRAAAELSIEAANGDDDVAVLAVAGELDSASAASLAEAVGAVLANNPERLVFDLGGLRFMDSAGIAVLINAARAVATVELRNPSPIVRRVIEMTGLTSVFEVVS